MLALLSLPLISLISFIATQSVADNLFTDWAPSDLNDATISDSNSLAPGGGTNTDQLLAFNDDPASNLLTSDYQPPSDGVDGSLQATNLLDDNQASTNAPLDMSNMFLDSTALGSPNDQALPDLSNDLIGSDPTPPGLLADGASADCSSFKPSSSSKKRRKRGNACDAADFHAAGANFFQKSAAAQAESYKKFVCPVEHYGAAVTIPVCSSADPTKTVRMGPYSPTYPDSDVLADSNLLLWNEASGCVGVRRPYCCGVWTPNIFTQILDPSDPRVNTGTGLNCYDMFTPADSFEQLQFQMSN